jgi:hypothetical protein
MTGSAFSNVLLLTTVFNFDATVDYISDVIFLLKKWLVVIAVPNLSPSATLSSLPVLSSISLLDLRPCKLRLNSTLGVIIWLVAVICCDKFYYFKLPRLLTLCGSILNIFGLLLSFASNAFTSNLEFDMISEGLISLTALGSFGNMSFGLSFDCEGRIFSRGNFAIYSYFFLSLNMIVLERMLSSFSI